MKDRKMYKLQILLKGIILQYNILALSGFTIPIFQQTNFILKRNAETVRTFMVQNARVESNNFSNRRVTRTKSSYRKKYYNTQRLNGLDARKELRRKTDDLLNSCPVGAMNSTQLREARNLITSWSAYHIPGNGEMSEKLLRRILLEKKEGKEMVEISANLYNLVRISLL